MSADADGVRLACGMELGALIEQIVEGRAPTDAAHQAGCEFCQAALAKAREVWDGLRELAVVEVAVPAGLTEAIMRRVRAAPHEAREAGRVVAAAAEALLARLTGQRRGTTQVRGGVIGLIAQRAAASLPEVRVRHVDLAVDDEQRALITVRIAVSYGPPLADVVARVRVRVIEHVERLAGVPVASAQVVVEDIDAPDQR